MLRRLPTRTARQAAALVALLTVPTADARADGARTVAKATSAAATFAAREPDGGGFRVLPENAPLDAGDLLVTLPGASLATVNGAVALKSLADYDGQSPLPTLETAFTLNDPKDADLDVTLDRGRIDLTNTRAEGKAVARVRFWDQAWTITLDSPGTRVAFELSARWPAGTRFRPGDPPPGEKPPAPVASLVLLVLKGSATAELGGFALGLSAPPGPALVEWDSETGARPEPLKLDKLPEWADPEAAPSEDGRKAAAAVEKFRRARAETPSAAVAAFLASADPAEQRVALVTLGALDDLPGLVRVLGGAKTREEWDFGITVVRHWLGRAAGNDRRLYEALTSPAQGYSPAHARIILQLLLGFGPDDLKLPETYELLVLYLAHDRAAVRNLAAWHLVRLVPAGQGIGYKPGGTKEEAAAAQKAWRKLIPAGQLPPAPKKG
jgi:hypothetical protein